MKVKMFLYLVYILDFVVVDWIIYLEFSLKNIKIDFFSFG